MLWVRTSRVLALLALSFGSFDVRGEPDEVPESKVFKMMFVEKQGLDVREIEMRGTFREYSLVLEMTQDLKKDGHDWCAFWRELHKIEKDLEIQLYWTPAEMKDFSWKLNRDCKRKFALSFKKGRVDETTKEPEQAKSLYEKSMDSLSDYVPGGVKHAWGLYSDMAEKKIPVDTNTIIIVVVTFGVLTLLLFVVLITALVIASSNGRKNYEVDTVGVVHDMNRKSE
ncbi:hypothetical protein L596_015908 [Steinernema carpocapsae]|uniref:Uncharacterized protein n=1 Tax=Steinernema carpocapsae TaxID=34508 RepID=A0A4U5NGE8_STECR|nr:hypothetical protein L596_015908 [Steinernema carpocapsae]